MSKKRKWYILETELHSHYCKDKDIFQPFTDECLIDDFKEAQEIGTMLRNKGYQTEVMPFDIEECNSNDFGTLGVYFERDVLTKKVEELKQQLAEKDKEITMLKSQNQFFMEETKRLDQLSNLKDKEIEELKKDLKSQKCLTDLYLTIAGTNATKMSIEKATRHQICEKIRKDFDKLCEEQDNLDYICTYGLDKILDQIEKGE